MKLTLTSASTAHRARETVEMLSRETWILYHPCNGLIAYRCGTKRPEFWH